MVSLSRFWRASTSRAADKAATTELELLRSVVEGIHGIEVLFGAAGELCWISPSVERLTARPPTSFLSAEDPLALLVHPSDLAYCRRVMGEVLESGEARDFELRLHCDDGGINWVACHWRALRDRQGSVSGVRLSAEDIQARKETEYTLLETVAELRRAQALREHYLSRSNDERHRLSALLNVIRLGILFIDRDHRVLYYNRAMLDLWAYPPDENLIGVRDIVLQSTVTPLLASPAEYLAHIESVIHCPTVSEPYEIHFKDGRVVTDLSAVVEGGQDGRGIGRVWIYEDVTERRRVAQQLVALAERDPLTNLFNRRRFHEELERLLADAARREVAVGLLTFDLDGFKPINDQYGHQAGDEVLVGLAEGVRRIVRRNEMFFRLGGDEFAVLVADASAEALAELATRLVEGIAAMQFRFGDKTVGVSASIGVACFPQHGTDGEALMAAADAAMYRAKAGGRNRWMSAASAADKTGRC